LFKNRLFFKLISIFTLPVVLILLYGAFLVYQKNEAVKEIQILEDNAVFIKNIKELIFALDKEENIVIKYFINKNSELNLKKEYKDSEEAYKNLMETINILNLNQKVETLDYNLNRVKEIRNGIDNETIELSNIYEAYNSTKRDILSSIFFSKHFKYASSSNLDMSKIIEFLTFNENTKYLKELISTLNEAVEKETHSAKHEIIKDKNISILFFIILLITMSSLFFVLRAIVTKEQDSYLKIKRYKEIYEILSKTNKFLTKTYDKESLYPNICEILSQNEDLKFAFFYDVEDKQIFAQEGSFKDTILSQATNYKDISHENLVSKTVKWQSNIVINSFDDKNLSVFYSKSNDLNINSMATFPVKKFDKVVAVMIIYSTKIGFFDKEVELLFDKLVNDISHCLEKIKYEELRVVQEDDLRLSSYSFDVAEPMLITDTKGIIVRVNQAFCSIMGYSKEELLGQNPRIFKTPHQNFKFIEDMWNSMRINGFWSGELYNKKANDEIIPLKATINAIKNKDGKATHYLGQYVDIGKIKDKEKVLEYQATHDSLTGLPNRLLLTDRIEQAIRKVSRHKIIAGLIFIDLDNFKVVNDTLGHDIGDILLINAAKKMKECIREEDTVSRVGGDEFVVLLDNLGSTKEDARRNIIYLATKIKDALNSIKEIEGHINVSTPSIGITLFNDDSVSVKDLIKQADTAMYEAKKQGKNSIELFED
jgi:diguanylate cyclase (GGDEF)-like protein/PAS domain S-box-containing protein